MESIKTLVIWLAILEGIAGLNGVLSLGLSDSFIGLIGLGMIGITITLLVKTNK